MPRGRRRADPGIGHNTQPTDEQVRDYGRRLADAKRDLREVMDEAASKRGTISSIKKAAKKAGVDMKALVRVVDEMVRDHDEVVAEERAYIRMRAVLNIPVYQDDLFPQDAPLPVLSDDEAAKQALHQAGAAGYMAGLNAHDINAANPHPQGTEEWVKWREQWHAGQAHLAKGLMPKRAARTDRQRRAPPTAANANELTQAVIDEINSQDEAG